MPHDFGWLEIPHFLNRRFHMQFQPKSVTCAFPHITYRIKAAVYF